MIDWKKVSKKDYVLINEIAYRAWELVGKSYNDRVSMEMDIAACHIVCPLKLRELLEADKFNFLHDVAGIGSHLNRKTGQLEDCFVPRYAK